MKQIKKGRIFGLAGWLFADLLLVLFIVALGASAYFDPAHAKGNKTQILALDPNPITIVATIKPSLIRSQNQDEVSKLREFLDKTLLLQKNKEGSLSGIVMTFSDGDNCSNRISGSATSIVINRLLREWYPDFITSNTVLKPYITANCRQEDNLKLEIYQFVNK